MALATAPGVALITALLGVLAWVTTLLGLGLAKLLFGLPNLWSLADLGVPAGPHFGLLGSYHAVGSYHFGVVPFLI